jgi:hypothetical protein
MVSNSVWPAGQSIPLTDRARAGHGDFGEVPAQAGARSNADGCRRGAAHPDRDINVAARRVEERVTRGLSTGSSAADVPFRAQDGELPRRVSRRCNFLGAAHFLRGRCRPHSPSRTKDKGQPPWESVTTNPESGQSALTARDERDLPGKQRADQPTDAQTNNRLILSMWRSPRRALTASSFDARRAGYHAQRRHCEHGRQRRRPERLALGRRRRRRDGRRRPAGTVRAAVTSCRRRVIRRRKRYGGCMAILPRRTPRGHSALVVAALSELILNLLMRMSTAPLELQSESEFFWRLCDLKIRLSPTH